MIHPWLGLEHLQVEVRNGTSLRNMEIGVKRPVEGTIKSPGGILMQRSKRWQGRIWTHWVVLLILISIRTKISAWNSLAQRLSSIHMYYGEISKIQSAWCINAHRAFTHSGFKYNLKQPGLSRMIFYRQHPDGPRRHFVPTFRQDHQKKKLGLDDVLIKTRILINTPSSLPWRFFCLTRNRVGKGIT